MKHELPDLPYSLDALEPHISRETLDYHYNKHHAGYVKKLNGLLDDNRSANGKSLEDIIMDSEPGENLFNNAAQVWNHTFYWNSMTPKQGPVGDDALSAAIKKSYGGMDKLKDEFIKTAKGQFGSGWAWLTRNDDGSLEIISTPDADNAIRHKKHPLITCDVWEHAYYIDYRNARPDYLEAFWKLVNWEFAARNYNSG